MPKGYPLPKGMADWSKWDGQSYFRNNKNRPKGVGTVSASRRERVRAKAIARGQAALAAAQAAQAAQTPHLQPVLTPLAKRRLLQPLLAKRRLLEPLLAKRSLGHHKLSTTKVSKN